MAVMFVLLFLSCKTADPVKFKNTGFAAPLAKSYAEAFYRVDSKKKMQLLQDMVEPECLARLNAEGLEKLIEKRSHIGARKEKFDIEIIEEFDSQAEFCFIYLLKKENYGLFSKNYRSLKIERVICVMKDNRWFVSIPANEQAKGYGVDTVFQSNVKDLQAYPDKVAFLKDVIDKDYQTARLFFMAENAPEASRAELVQELLDKGIRFYDKEDYREAMRLFQKALSISSGTSEKAATYLKRCQKAIEMGL
jgi:hypothetical protein